MVSKMKNMYSKITFIEVLNQYIKDLNINAEDSFKFVNITSNLIPNERMNYNTEVILGCYTFNINSEKPFILYNEVDDMNTVNSFIELLEAKEVMNKMMNTKFDVRNINVKFNEITFLCNDCKLKK